MQNAALEHSFFAPFSTIFSICQNKSHCILPAWNTQSIAFYPSPSSLHPSRFISCIRTHPAHTHTVFFSKYFRKANDLQIFMCDLKQNLLFPSSFFMLPELIPLLYALHFMRANITTPILIWSSCRPPSSPLAFALFFFTCRHGESFHNNVFFLFIFYHLSSEKWSSIKFNVIVYTHNHFEASYVYWMDERSVLNATLCYWKYASLSAVSLNQPRWWNAWKKQRRKSDSLD